MAELSGLTVRQHERKAFELAAEFVVADAHRAQVRFSATSAAAEPHVIAARTVDISPGGLGLSVRQFLPRMCEGAVRLFDPKPVGSKHDGTPIFRVAFEHAVKVRRVRMTSHEPSYLLGLSFMDPERDLDERLAALQASAAAVAAPASLPGGAHAQP
jgi:hypothetical protein